MDISESITPRSDQLNSEDLLAGPITVTVEKVTAGSAEQPVEIHIKERPGRPYKPSKTMRRLIVLGWGPEASLYPGHQLTLYRNPDITFGKDRVGGIEISHLSHIEQAFTVALTTTRGRRKDFTVKPLQVQHPTTSATPDRDAQHATPVQDPVLVDEWISVINEASTIAQLEAAWRGAIGADVAREPDVIAAKDKRKTELKEN